MSSPSGWVCYIRCKNRKKPVLLVRMERWGEVERPGSPLMPKRWNLKCHCSQPCTAGKFEIQKYLCRKKCFFALVEQKPWRGTRCERTAGTYYNTPGSLLGNSKENNPRGISGNNGSPLPRVGERGFPKEIPALSVKTGLLVNQYTLKRAFKAEGRIFTKGRRHSGGTWWILEYHLCRKGRRAAANQRMKMTSRKGQS